MNLKELLQAAKAAIAEGDLEKAKKLKSQAEALKEVEALEPAEEPKETPEQKAAWEDMKAQLAELKAFKEKVESEPAINGNGGYITDVEDEADRSLKKRPYKSLGEFLQDVLKEGQGAGTDQRLLPLRSKDPFDENGYSLSKAMGDEYVGSLTEAAMKSSKMAKAPTGANTLTPSEGGFLTGPDRMTNIMARVYEVGNVLQRVDMVGVSANGNGMTFFAEDETSRATGSRRGGIRFYWVSEGGDKTASQPKFREMELRLRKAAALVYATDEMLADASALENWILRNLPEELRFGVEDSIFNGDGAGKPLGILESPCVVSVAKETGQAAATLVTENIIKMWARMWGPSRMRAAWYINQDIEPQLYQLNLPVGTGGQLVYMPPGGLSQSPYGTLFGRPVIPIEYAQTLGTEGDIILANMDEYQMIEKSGIQSASSIHVRFVNGEQVFRFIYRVDGQPKWNSALTPKNGTNSLSPFVVLATRS